MLDADKSHLDVTWVSQSLYSGPLSNPDFFLSLIAGRIRQVVLYMSELAARQHHTQTKDGIRSKMIIQGQLLTFLHILVMGSDRSCTHNIYFFFIF